MITVGASAGWLPLHVKWNWFSTQISDHFTYQHGTKNANLMFNKINMSELECFMYGMSVIFKQTIAPSLMSYFFQVISGFKNSYEP